MLRNPELLGEGASGGSYLFQDLSTKRKVAIKKSEPIEGENDETFKRFVNEAEILTQINHVVLHVFTIKIARRS